MTVYIEIIFLDNFLLDSLLLWLVSRFSSRRKISRIIAVGFLGGVYAVIAALIPLLSSLFFKFLFGFFMTALCFPRCIAKSFLFFLLFSALFSGVAFALNFSYETYITRERLMLISSFIILLLAELLCRTNFTPAESITAEVILDDCSFVFPAEYDSGCNVRDHRGKAAILIDRSFFEANIKDCRQTDKCKTRTFHVTTAAGAAEFIGILPKKILLKDRRGTLIADAWLVLADNIRFNGAPAIFGKGLITESEENKCRHFSKSAFSGLLHFFRKIVVTMSTAANRFLHRSQRKKKPPFS